MVQAVDQLQQLGFSQYEAQAYVALLQQNPLNGYELSKASGIPRANIYAILQKLEDRGAVLRVESPEGVRYSPVTPQELVSRLKGRFEDSLENARGALEELDRCEAGELVRNARGYPVMLEHAQSVIEAAQKQLLVANYPDEAQAISDAIEEAQERGVAVTTLCLHGCRQECGNCHGKVFRYRVSPEKDTRFLVLVPDGKEVLAAEVPASEDAQVVRTRQKMLVNLASWYVRHHIALAAILIGLGDRVNNLLDPQTLAILESIAPEGSDLGWLEYMHRLLGSEEAAETLKIDQPGEVEVE